MSTSKRDLRASGDLVMAPRVPHGLAAAVEGLTREVIRNRPEDIYVFAAQHFEELLKLRDEYGAVTNLPGKSTNTAALREMNQALKKRSGVEKGSKSGKERGGWSMNETARVLERHRSIFGDKGRKLSPEEVRALGNEKENKSRRREDLERFGNGSNYQKRRGSSERFVRRKIPPKDPDPGENKSKSDSNGNPKIISQIPTLTQSTGLLAKDIKSELRKNRNSSRDARNIRERAERKASERTERLEFNPRLPGAARKTLTRSPHERSLDKLIDAENERDDMFASKILTDNQKPKTDASGRSRSFAKMPRTLSMDRVREFVIEKFRGSESWEELRSTNYVDRVQEVIDEASPSILRRVKELSTRSAGRSRGYESVDESTSTSTRSDKSNQTDDIRSRSAMSATGRSRRTTRRTKSKSKSKTSGADSLEGIETLASETEQPKEIRNEIEAGKVKKGLAKGTLNGLSGESDASDYADLIRKASASSSISLPAVRPPSSKNHSRSVSRSDSDNLVLPPIPPEVPRSAKYREELVLPSLQITKEVVRSVEAPLEDNALQDTAEAELNLPDAPTDEIFKDSLNVTPEIEASPRPDSLEPEAGLRDDENGDNIAELKTKLNEIDSATDDRGVEVADGNSEMKERLKEIEETEKRIEDILKTESQESRVENMDAVSVKEKLIEIQEAEERLRDILDPGANVEEGGDLGAEEIQKDVSDPGMKERLMEIEETEKRIEMILDPVPQGIQKVAEDPGVKEKLMEIEETEKRIEQILNPEKAEEVHETEIENDVKEKLVEIEETEKRIEEVLDTQTLQGVQRDVGMKEKLMEIEETEKRIEKIFHSEVQDEETNAGFMKNKLMEIEEAEKRLKNVFDSTSGIEQSHNSTPKTPFIPEIPSEYVTSANQAENIDEEDKHEVATTDNQQSTNPEATENDPAERVETKAQATDPKVEQFSSGTPDSLGNSYVLTEGSPYDIPDSVTTVIIPERPTDSPSSDILEIVLEDDPGEGAGLVETTDAKGGEESAEDESREISLRNILDNFGEVVHQEAVPSPTDVDFIKNLKTSSDVVIPRKDLGLIAEEDDKEIAEIGAPEVAKDPILHDIAETEEVLDLEEPGISPSTNPHDPEVEDSIGEAKGASEVAEEASGPKEEEAEESGGRKTRSLETIDLEVASLQQNVTDSGTTESTDEVKETTISDDAGNTAAESSVTSPSCGEEIGARNSESSNEVKETTISDRPAEEAEKNLFSLVPQCHGTMPHVPELNLDSLQDITVSSFQLSDDATAEEEEEESDAGQPHSENYPSIMTDDAHESLEHEPVREDIITKEKVEIDEDPCTKVAAYVEGPNSEDSELKDVGLERTSSKEEAEESGIFEPVEKVEEVVEETKKPNEVLEEEIIETITEPEEATGVVAEKVNEEVVEGEPNHGHDETAENVEDKGSVGDPKEVVEETAKDANLEKVLEEKPEDSDKNKPEKATEEIHDELVEEMANKGLVELHEEIIEHVAEKEPQEVHEEVAEEVEKKADQQLAENIPKQEPEEKPEDEAAKPTEKEVHEEAVESSVKKELEEKPEDPVKEEPEEGRKDEAGRLSTEEIHEEAVESSVKKEFEENPEDSVKEEPEDEAGKLPPEEIHKDVVESSVEKEFEEKPEELVKKEPEDEADKLPTGEIHKDAVENSVEKKFGEKPEDSVNREPEDEAGKLPTEEIHKDAVENSTENESEEKSEKKSEDPAKKDPEEEPKEKAEDAHEDPAKDDPEKDSEDAVSKSQISELETVSLNDFKALEASIGKEYSEKSTPSNIEVVKSLESNHQPESSSDPEVDLKVDETDSNSVMRVGPEVGELKEPEEAKDSLISDKIHDPLSGNLDPPKAEVVTNDLDENSGERLKEYHIYVPEVTASEEFSTTESSTFNSAATKIQAGVRGFLTRRRLQSAQRRSSTLDSVPSIQDSLAADVPHLEPIEEVGLSQAATTIQSSYRGYKARQRLRREDAVQKTTMSVESPFSGVGLQHTGEFHDCLPLPQFHHDEKRLAVSRPVTSQNDPDTESQENRDWVTESTTTKEESGDDDSTFGLLVNKYPYAHQGLNVVVLSGNDAVLQSQYLNFITSIEEAHNETDSPVPGMNPPKVIDAFSTMKSNAGIESLPLDNLDTDVSAQDTSISAREPLAVSGSPTALIIEELSKTEEESLPVDATSTSSTSRVKTETDVENDVVSGVQDDSLDLPGLSLEGRHEGVNRVTVTSGKDCHEAGKTEDVDETRASMASDAPQDASLGTMSFSMNVDDMLGLGAESDPPATKMKPIFEVTVTPRDLLKLTNRSQGSQASGDRAESPVTMMQIVPKSVEDKSDRSEDEKDADAKRGEQEHGGNRPINEIPEEAETKIEPSNSQEVKTSSNEDEESSDGKSRTFSIEKN